MSNYNMFNPKKWATGDTIDADNLNRMENNITQNTSNIANLNSQMVDFTRVETIIIVNGTLQLTESLTQYCTMEDFTEIVLPNTDKQRLQIHLNFMADSSYSLLLPLVYTQETIEIEEGKYHELIFEKVLNVWKVGVVKYGQEVTV